MTGSDWEKRWQAKQQEEMPAADPWLQQQTELLGTGVALDLACGRGRNSLWLAERGYTVHAIDSSLTAVSLLDAAASTSNDILTVHHNLEHGLPEKPEQADLILCFYFLQRNLFDAICARTRPGGLFIGRSFCQLHGRIPPADIIYNPGELACHFSDWHILSYEEGKHPAQKGGTLAGIVARKPLG